MFDKSDGHQLKVDVVIHLDTAAKELLAKEIKGDGGFQNIMRKIQGSVIGGNKLVLCEGLYKKIIEYQAANDGDGGFQGRMRSIVDTLRGMRDDFSKIGG